MKDSEFIELLNLYLDHEISAADAARLETEVLANPQRRSIYQDYCRIQKGCRLLAQEFQTETAPAAGGSVIAFDANPARRPRTYTIAGGLAAAAACLAIGFVAWNRTPANSQNQLVRGTQVIAVESQVAITPGPMNGERSIGPTVTLAKREESSSMAAAGLRLDSNPGAKTDLLNMTAGASSPQFDWMKAVQFTPIKRVPIEEFRFDARPLSPARINPPLWRDRAEEMNAIRFSR